MNTLEIILLILGVAAFFVSFFLPEKTAKISEEELKLGEQEIKKMVEQEMTTVRDKIEDVVDETINYSVEKTERSLERVSNEKIMAVNEYSDTVLNEIHRNHEEVMFLYDMLNQKQKALKDTALQAQQTVKEVRKEVREKVNETGEAVKKKGKEERKEELEPLMFEKVDVSQVKQAPKKTAGKKADIPSSKEKTPKVTVQFDAGGGKPNSNEKILALHKEGKSNMAIAKELGLGMGEVKLVIDLFEGM